MNLEDVLEQLQSQGQAESAGQFTLALPQLLDGLSRSLLLDPEHAPLMIAAAAVHAGARQLEIETRPGLVQYRFDMEEPDLSRPDLATRGSARWLIMALAAQRYHARQVSLLYPGQRQELRLTSSGHEVRPWVPNSDLRVTLQLIPNKNAPPPLEALRRHCSLCPVPILSRGQLLQTPLAKAYRGWPMAWSESLPTLLKPPGEARLRTSLAVFMAQTRVPIPTWVAVVGGISYPFRIPEARQRVGILWHNELRANLDLRHIIQEESWTQTLAEVHHLVAAWSAGSAHL